MFNGILNLLRGQVYVRAECSFPERILNLCGEENLAFWNLKWESQTAFICCISRQDWKRLCQLTEDMDSELYIVHREGAPYFLSRFRQRYILFTALIICAMALFVSSFFIWDFQITGNKSVPEEKILRALEKQGVTLGTFGLSLDSEDLRNHVLLDIPELSWIAINVSGCRANVQVVERVKPPELIDEQTASNVVARRAGLILEIHAMDGLAVTMPGSTVEAGQLLISGIEDIDTLGSRTMAGRGSVRARTWYTLYTSFSLSSYEKRFTESKIFYSIAFGKHRIKFFSNSSVEGLEYDKISTRQRWLLFGIPLPITVIQEEVHFYETTPVTLSVIQAQKRAENALQEQLAAIVAPYGEVSSALCNSDQHGDILDVTLTAECVEEIGVAVPIYQVTSQNHSIEK